MGFLACHLMSSQKNMLNARAEKLSEPRRGYFSDEGPFDTDPHAQLT